MSASTTSEVSLIARDLQIPESKVANTLALLDEGNTIPFITRFRKDHTGGLDSEQVSDIRARAMMQRAINERKATILKSVEAQGHLTEELRSAIEVADSSKSLEDQYLPFKPKKQSLATQARQKGLASLADEVLAGHENEVEIHTRALDFVRVDRGVNSVEDVISGVKHLIAEHFGDDPKLRKSLREYLWREAKLASSRIGNGSNAAKANSKPPESASAESKDKQTTDSAAAGDADKKASPKKKSKKAKPDPFADFADFREPLAKLPPHRVLALNRADRAKAIRTRLEFDFDAVFQVARDQLEIEKRPHAEFLKQCLRDSLQRLILPALEREIRRELTESAEEHAVRVFARNLRQLLLQPPVPGKRVLGIDPGFKSGCKVAVLDETGAVVATDSFHLIGNEERIAAGKSSLCELIRTHNIQVLAIGNGTACRQTEKLIAELLEAEFADQEVGYMIVNEAGASVYSTSTIGREELPDLDPTLRSAVSIARRVLDPLSELVKINAANIGVGLYQHDVKGRHLQESLDEVVEACVNFVGVDVNTASPSLLRYVSGLNQLTARRIVEHRTANGPFKCREDLKQVPGIGDATFVQAAGFLKIVDGSEPLDATWIHPESYDTARAILTRLGVTEHQLTSRTAADTPSGSVEDLLAMVDVASLAKEMGVGRLLLQDLLDDLRRPGRDPREDLPPPEFRRGILKFEDLKPGMELAGRVLNVVDFGVFVDIGLGESALVHISKLSDRFVSDPHDVASVGDLIRVWVIDVDKSRRRVSLTADNRGRGKGASSSGRNKQTKPSARRGGRGNQSQRGDRPAGKGRPARAGSGRKTHVNKKHTDRPRKPKKPPKPITKDMVEGKKPMRSFSDLQQFFDIKKSDDSKDDKKD